MRLAALTGGHLFGNCTIMALAAIATNLKNELGINAEEYGWLIGIYMIVQGFIATVSYTHLTLPTNREG